MARKRAPCPGCRSANRDRSGDNLSLFDDDPSRGYCHVCARAWSVDGTEQPVSQRPTRYNERDTSLELLSVSSLPITALTHKPIDAEICERYGVRTSVAEETGTPNKVYYPYHDQDGNVTGYKVRHLPKQFEVIGKIKGLFGQQQCKKSAKLLILTEGEDDALAAYQMLRSLGKDYNVVSIPNGANLDGNLDAAVRAELEFITSHQIVMIAFDNDKPGQATAKALAELICSQTRVKILKLPRKDAGQMLIEGMAVEFEKAFHAKDFHPESVIRGSEISLQDLKTPKKRGYSIPYPELQKKLLGVRKGEITTFCAGSGIGKSTLVREIAHHLVTQHGLKVANVALESSVEDAARGYIAIELNAPLHRLMFYPDELDAAQYERAYDRLIKSDQIHFFRHWGSIESEKLIRKLHYFVKSLEVDFIVLDHVSMVVAGQDSDERKSLDTLMENLTNLVVETGVGVLAVVHLKRVQGKNYNTGAEIELTDLRGSAGIEQMSWNVIGIERNQQDDNAKNVSKIRVLKNRTIGYTGVADRLIYHHDTGRLLAADTSYQ